MRGLGLVGILVVIAIIFVIWTKQTSQVASVNKSVRPQMEQVAGVDSSGQRVSETYELMPVMDAGKLRGMKVVSLNDDSLMKSFYGLQKDDVITDVYTRGTSMKDSIGGDQEMMRSLIAEAYQSKQPIVVLRKNQTITLQPGAGSATNSPGTSGTSTPPPPPNDSKSSVQDQLDKITKPR